MFKEVFYIFEYFIDTMLFSNLKFKNDFFFLILSFFVFFFVVSLSLFTSTAALLNICSPPIDDGFILRRNCYTSTELVFIITTFFLSLYYITLQHSRAINFDVALYRDEALFRNNYTLHCVDTPYIVWQIPTILFY